MWRRCGDPDDTEVSYVDKHYEDEGQSFQRSNVARYDSYPEVYDSSPVPLGRVTQRQQRLLLAPEDNPDFLSAPRVEIPKTKIKNRMKPKVYLTFVVSSLVLN
jgi:hypothetical protein